QADPPVAAHALPLPDALPIPAEVADKLGFRDLNAVRPRLHELEKLGVVRVIGKRANPRSGINNAIYELIEKAPASGTNTGEGTRSEEHTSESSHVSISYAVFC